MDSSTEAETENTGFAARHGKIIPKPANKGAFSFTIPLRHIFGFSDDYDKIVYVLKHALSLVRVIQTPMPCTEPPQSTMWQKIFWVRSLGSFFTSPHQTKTRCGCTKPYKVKVKSTVDFAWGSVILSPFPKTHNSTGAYLPQVVLKSLDIQSLQSKPTKVWIRPMTPPCAITFDCGT